MLMIVWSAILTLVFAGLLLWCYIRARPIPGIPYWPDGHFLWGDISRLQRAMKEQHSVMWGIDDTAKQLGPISQLRVGPFGHVVVIADLNETEALLTRRHSSLERDSSSISIFRTIIPGALLTLKTNEVWKHHRRIIGPAMTSKYLTLTMPKAYDSVGQLIELWKAKGDICGDRSWSAGSDLEGATMDAICGMAFGHPWGVIRQYTHLVRAMDRQRLPVGPLGAIDFKLVAPDLAESTWRIFTSIPLRGPFPRISHFVTRLSASYRRQARLVDQFLDRKLIEARQKAKLLGADSANETADNTLDMMVARELRGEDWMTDEEMKQELFQYLLAGTETSSTTLSWWCKFMTNHPEVQRKLRAHLYERLPDVQNGTPSFEELNAANTPYLEAVVHETLRLARTAGGVSREVKHDMFILGKLVPKGTQLVLPTSIGCEDLSSPVSAPLHTDDEKSRGYKNPQASFWAGPTDAENFPRKVGFWKAGTGLQFDPERWMDQDGKFDIHAGPSMPFSLGQRGCFGKNLAMLELRVFVSQLNVAFFFAPIPESQNIFDRVETVTSHPIYSYIRPVPWSTVEAQGDT